MHTLRHVTTKPLLSATGA